MDTLRVPDELIAWGKTPEVAVHFASPWADEVEEFAVKSQEVPLAGRRLERFWSRLEALCHAAVAAGQHKLLLGFDMHTAEFLRLHYTFETPDGPVTFGVGGDWTFDELRLLLASSDPPMALRQAQRARKLLSGFSSRTRVSAVTDEGSSGLPACSGCGTTVVAMVELDTGGRFCGDCWHQMTTPWPRYDSRGRRVE